MVGRDTTQKVLAKVRGLRRLGGLAAIVGGLLWATLQYLWFLGHGPTGVDAGRLVFGLRNQEYDRLLIIPMGLVLFAFVTLHDCQKRNLGRLGQAGYVLALAGYAVLALGQYLAGFTFYFGHPVTVVGFVLGLIGLFVLLLIGWLIYGIASLQAKVLTWWSRPIPLLMGVAVLLALLWAILDFAAISGYPPSVVFAALHGSGWILLGYVIWSSRIREM